MERWSDGAMGGGWIALVLLAFSPGVILVVHMILSRLLRQTQHQKVTILAGFAGYIPMAFLLWFFTLRDFSGRSSELASGVVYCFVVYSCVAYSYFHLFNMSETARRIRILHEIYKAGSLAEDQILAIYNACDVVEVRLERLVSTGQLALRRGAYVLRGRSLYWAAMAIEVWRTLLGFQTVGAKKGTPFAKKL